MNVTTTPLESPETVTSNYTPPNITDVVIPFQEIYNLQKANDFIGRYYIWIIFAFGFPGNLISLCIIIRMSRDRLSTSLFHVALLAVVDNLAIVLKIIENQIRYNQVEMAAASCKILYFLGLTFAAYPNWILIIMSAERFTAVRVPLKVALIWSLKRAVIIMVAVFLILGIIDAHIFFTMTSIKLSCRPFVEYKRFYYPWWFVISSSVYAIIPAITLTLLNILIILHLRRATLQRRNLTTSEAGQTRNDARRQDRQMTVMLVTLAIVFIILTVPKCILCVVWDYWKPDDLLGKTRKYFLNILTANIADTNHAVNFYLYFVSGSKFRDHFMQLCNLGCTRNRTPSNRG